MIIMEKVAAGRGHSVDYVFDEINAVMEKTGKYRFYFVDPNFFGPGAKGQRRALAMASKLKPLGIRFGIEARVNDIHEDTVCSFDGGGIGGFAHRLGKRQSAPVSME